MKARQARRSAPVASSVTQADIERERIAAIDELALPGFEVFIAEAKADPDATPGGRDGARPPDEGTQTKPCTVGRGLTARLSRTQRR